MLSYEEVKQYFQEQQQSSSEEKRKLKNPGQTRSASGFMLIPGCQKQDYTVKHTHAKKKKKMHLDTMQTVYLKIETTANRNSLVFKPYLTFVDKNSDAVLCILCAVTQKYSFTLQTCWQHFQTWHQWVASFLLYLDSDRWFIRFIWRRVTPQGWRKVSWQPYLPHLVKNKL